MGTESHRTRTTTSPSRVAMLTATIVVGALLAGCGGGGEGSTAAEDDRQAGAITRGTEVCITNGSSDPFTIEVLQSGPTYPSTAPTEFGPRTTRCIDSDSYAASGAAYARVTIASGERFTVQGFNPPFDPPWIAVNGDGRSLQIGGTTDFKIGKHPIVGERIEDSSGYVQFAVSIR